MQVGADIGVFGGLGLIFDDDHFVRRWFQNEGLFNRPVMLVTFAGEPIAGRLLVPDKAPAVAERYAVDAIERVLVLPTEMAAAADAMKGIGIAVERIIPFSGGHLGDLYTQTGHCCEGACDFKGAGSVTIMPSKDVTYPVSESIDQITEGQFYLHDGLIEPFGPLSRLKQRFSGTVTRADHPRGPESHDPSLRECP